MTCPVDEVRACPRCAGVLHGVVGDQHARPPPPAICRWRSPTLIGSTPAKGSSKSMERGPERGRSPPRRSPPKLLTQLLGDGEPRLLEQRLGPASRAVRSSASVPARHRGLGVAKTDGSSRRQPSTGPRSNGQPGELQPPRPPRLLPAPARRTILKVVVSLPRSDGRRSPRARPRAVPRPPPRRRRTSPTWRAASPPSGAFAGGPGWRLLLARLLALATRARPSPAPPR